MAQKMEEKFSTFEIEHVPRNENRFADALAALGSQIMFEGDSTRVEVNKRKESIVREYRPQLIELTSFKPKLLIRFIMNKTC